mmetsp:Transcript_70739/g.207517  ORF Transcript_70739/g.207517 Transcript_70739/m.207517 type:complete len:201 (+) Transcript_70739:645-1247(+)
MHEGRDGAHRPPPQADRRHLASLAEVVHACSKVVTLKPSQGNVLPLALAAAGEVEAEERHAQREQEGHQVERLQAAGGVLVKVDHYRLRLHTISWLALGKLLDHEVGTPQVQPTAFHVDVHALDPTTPQPEIGGPEALQGIAPPRGPDDEVPQRQAIRLPRQLQAVLAQLLQGLSLLPRRHGHGQRGAGPRRSRRLLHRS